jgi:hypothetical protein
MKMHVAVSRLFSKQKWPQQKGDPTETARGQANCAPVPAQTSGLEIKRQPEPTVSKELIH